MVSELVAKLRAKRMRVHDLSGVGWEDDPDCIEAADRIEALSRQLEEVREAFLDRALAPDVAAKVKDAFEIGLTRYTTTILPNEIARPLFEALSAKETVSHG